MSSVTHSVRAKTAEDLRAALIHELDRRIEMLPYKERKRDQLRVDGEREAFTDFRNFLQDLEIES